MELIKYMTISFALLTTVFLGLELSFNVYAIELKSTFNFTQTEVELISSAGLIGMGLSLVEVVVTNTFGVQGGYVFIWLTTSGSAFLLWLSVIYKDYFSHWSIIAIIHFILSAGQNAGSSRLTSIAVTKVGRSNSGKIVGMFYSAIAVAKTVYGMLLHRVFDNDLQDFFLCVSLLCSVSVGVCAVFHKPVDTSIEAEEKETIPLKSQGETTLAFEEQTTHFTLIKSRFFHLILLPSAICYSVSFTLMNNITSIAQSAHILQPVNTVYLLSVIVIAGRFVFGSLFDKWSTQNCGIGLVCLSSSSVLLGIFLYVVSFNSTMVYILTMAVGLGMSGGLTIPCMMLTMKFGRHYFPFVVGCMYALASALSLLFQCILGFVYDMRMLTDGSCFGQTCFFASLLVLLGAMVVSTAFNAFNLIKKLLDTQLHKK